VPVPFEYNAAGPQFHQLLRDARDYSGLTTTNQTYTMVQGVLLAFRRRVTIDDGLRFCDVLPAVARAIFVHRWDVHAPPVPFGDRADWTREVQALRLDHNYAPNNCVSNVAAAVRRNVDTRAFDACLATLGPRAVDFWTPTSEDQERDTLEHHFPGPIWMAPIGGRPGSDQRPARRPNLR
jgi:uncharacterized protein (DUF2267 family)